MNVLVTERCEIVLQMTKWGRPQRWMQKRTRLYMYKDSNRWSYITILWMRQRQLKWRSMAGKPDYPQKLGCITADLCKLVLTLQHFSTATRFAHFFALSAASYTNTSTHLNWECSKGHTWWAVPMSVKRGTWCKKCAQQNRKSKACCRRSRAFRQTFRP